MYYNTIYTAKNHAINESNPILSSFPSTDFSVTQTQPTRQRVILPQYSTITDDAKDKAQLLYSNVIGRPDAYGEFVDFTHHTCQKENLTLSKIYNHVMGNTHVGVYLLNPSIDQGRSVYFCTYDIDSDVNWLERAVELKSFHYDHWGLELLIERSKSKNSGHLWQFFSEPIPADKLRHLANYTFSQIGWKCEFFPKQERISKSNYGNYIYLPWSGRYTKDNQCLFVDDSGIAIEDQLTYLSEAFKPHFDEMDKIFETLPEKKQSIVKRLFQGFSSEIKMGDPPSKFFSLLKMCPKLKWLWSGQRKIFSKKRPDEIERSDSDWALGRQCIEYGITDEQELINILARFPHGKYQCDKSIQYLQLTIHKLLETAIIPLSRDDARAKLAQVIGQELDNLSPGLLSLIHATPGLGKTYIAEKIVADKIKGGSDIKVLFGMPTIQRAEEEGLAFKQRFGILATILYGRNPNNCRNFDFVQDVTAIGGSPGKSVCSHCPFLEGCKTDGYHAQFKTRAQVCFCTYEQVLELHETGKLDADVIILDECPERAIQNCHLFTVNSVKIEDSTETPITVSRFIDAVWMTISLAKKKRDYYGKEFIQLFEQGIALANQLPQFGPFGNIPLCFDELLQVALDIEMLHTRVTQENIKTIPNLNLSYVARELHAMWTTLQTSNKFNSNLIITTDGILKCRERRTLHQTTPIIVLDAYARESFYEQLIPSRDIHIHRIEAKLNVEIIYIPINVAKHRLVDMFKSQEKVIQNIIHNIIRGPCEGNYDGTVLYTYKIFEQELIATVSIETGHLWAGRGTNIHEVKQNLIICAGGSPHPTELLADCRALYRNDPEPIDPTPDPKNRRRYLDPRLELLRKMRQDDELTQVAHRIRPVNANHEDRKRIIVMSTVIIEGLAPDVVLEPSLFYKTPAQVSRKSALKQLMEICHDDFKFWQDSILESLREIAGTRTGPSVCQPPNKDLIRALTQDSRSKALSLLPYLTYPEKYRVDKNGFLKDRDAIVNELKLPKERVSIKDGVYHSYIVYGDKESARIILESAVVNNGSNPTCVSDMLSDDRIVDLVEYGEILEGYDVYQEVQKIAEQPIPSYWTIQKKVDVFYVRFKSEMRMQFLNRFTKMGKYLKEYFDLTVQELAEIYLDLITTPNST